MLKSFHLQTAYTVHVCIEGTRALCCSGLLVGFGKSEDWEKCLHKLVFEKMLLSLITAFTQISGAVSVQCAKKSKTRIISDWYRHIKWILLWKKTLIFDPRNGNFWYYQTRAREMMASRGSKIDSYYFFLSSMLLLLKLQIKFHLTSIT